MYQKCMEKYFLLKHHPIYKWTSIVFVYQRKSNVPFNYFQTTIPIPFYFLLNYFQADCGRDVHKLKNEN